MNIFKRYPQLVTLKGIVPDDVVERAISPQADKFDQYLLDSEKLVPTVNLNKIFPSEVETGRIVLENFLGHWGNVSIEEVCKICLIINFLKPRKILELGTYNGMTTLQMALNAPKDCKIYTLDLPDNYDPNIKLSELDWHVAKSIKSKFGTKTGSYFADYPENKNIIQLLGDSATFNYEEVGNDIDLIFIDAAHDFENKLIDTENAYRLIRKGGVIIWHDYKSPANPEVTRFINMQAQHKKIFHLRNTMLAIHINE
jgi:predicted O-methyltransferase YrrM